MRLRDLLAMCRLNLRRRKGRTILTTLGVMIGCTAIIIMVSIGVGSAESMDLMLQSMGDLTMIEVYGYGQTALTEDALEQMALMDHVRAATPRMYCPFGFTVSAGNNDRYQQPWGSMMGMKASAMGDVGFSLLEGDFPTPGAKDIQIVVGQYFSYTFQDTRRPDGRNMIDRYIFDENGNLDTENIPDPYFDPMGMKMKMTITIDEYTVIEKTLRVVGVMKEDPGKGYETTEGIIMDITDLRALSDEITRAQGGTVKKEDVKYDNAMVKTDSIDNVAQVQSEIKNMGYETWSMESIREPMLEETNRQQMVFGGLGAISLIVAAIGIMNTMVMSITERTSEIGVMKALGCYVKDIRRIFLLEAAAIGLLGGLAGIIISLIISLVMNLVSAGGWDYLTSAQPMVSFGEIWTAATTPGSRISVIPFWLVAMGLGISLAIGLLSGFYPANKAVKIPALEAIKHEN